MGTSIGVVEGFFGPAWPDSDRRAFAPFIAQTGGGFYIYAPKQDPHLRKRWREEWTPEYLSQLRSLALHFQTHKVVFGVGLSPFGLGEHLEPTDVALVKQKLRQLEDAGVKILGLFFDDMPTNPGLASAQIACVEIVRQSFKGKIVFCPSYYTPDPILDKVFGPRPEHYFEDIAAGIPPHISLAWTGPKVISLEIPIAHAQEVGALLKRKPFIWENFFANDGPKNCKFLKLKPFSGRERAVSDWVEAYAFNMMNQPNLSKIVFLAARLVLENGHEPEAGLTEAIETLCSAELSHFLADHRLFYLERGLDQITAEEKFRQIAVLERIPGPFSSEILAWLKGEYVVGSECLTD